MRVLVVAATAGEIAPLVARLGRRVAGDAHVTSFERGSHAIDVLTTGVGMVATAVWCSRRLATSQYDMALNLGVCGSFDPELDVGSVVHVVSEQLPELGAEDGDGFLTVQDLKLVDGNEFPFQSGRLTNGAPPSNEALAHLTEVHGITVNTVHGNERSIAGVRARCQPQVESMEGAAFMHACLVNHTPFAEVRAISNVVERRNRGAWRIAEAVGNLNDTALRIIDCV